MEVVFDTPAIRLAVRNAPYRMALTEVSRVGCRLALSRQARIQKSSTRGDEVAAGVAWIGLTLGG